MILFSASGLFTLLVEDFGIEGVQVEEIYDLDTVTEMCRLGDRFCCLAQLSAIRKSVITLHIRYHRFQGAMCTLFFISSS